MVQVIATDVANKREDVYEYDPDTQKMRKEIQEFPPVTYFDNGMILAEWMRNQTHGMINSWPYHMYWYDMVSDEYFYVVCVTSWEKVMCSVGYPDGYEEIFGAANKIELQWHRITEGECFMFCVNSKSDIR